jgi:protein-tyrosine-phosphatase
MQKVLFVCLENSCRSQMAEAFAKIHGKIILEAYSAGSRASGKVNEKAIKSMQEVGYDLKTHHSKSLDEIPDVEYDFAITMGCGDECPFVKAKQRRDWTIPDPKHLNESDFNEVRNIIEKKILSLIQEIS